MTIRNTNNKLAKDISPIKLCQEKNIIYPARLALTSARLEKISATPEPLSLLPYGLPAENSDYELRRLRDGYVYIITIAVSDCLEASYTSDDYQLYLYQYSSPEFAENSEGIPYSFQQLFYAESLDELPVKACPPRAFAAKQYIELSKSASTIYILYSDMLLSAALLSKLMAEETSRKIWMRRVNLQQGIGVIALDNPAQYVKDFAEDALLINEEKSNLYRFAPIGKAREPIHLYSEAGKGFIIPVEDAIGTAHDLACYHYHLTQLRQDVAKI